MKKYIIGTLLLSACFSFVSAQVVGDTPLPSVGSSCVDLQNNLAYKQSKDSNSNGEVSDLQSFLQEQGLLTSDPTGYFGALTFNAVKTFQKQNNLLAYGYVGQMTRALIKDISCNGEYPVEIPATDPSNGVQVKFLPGCYSLSGYSITTGQACSGGERRACTQEMRLCPDGSSMQRDTNCGWHEEQCSTTSVPSNDPTALVISGPSLKLAYSNNKEAELIAKATVKVTAGNTDLNVVKPTASVWPSSALYFSLFALIADNGNGNGGVSISNLVVSSQNAYDKGDYWVIPAGASAVFNLYQTFNPKLMFAGSYHTVPYALMNEQNKSNLGNRNIISSKDGNYVTIIGETSPYINSVDCTSKVGVCFINGSRFPQNSNNVTINGITKVLLSEGLNYSSADNSVVGRSIFFNPSDFNLVSGNSYIVQISTNKGASNNFSFNFNSGGATNTPTTVGDIAVSSPTACDSDNKPCETWDIGDAGKIIKWTYPEVVAGKFLNLAVQLKSKDGMHSWDIERVNVVTSANGGYQLNAGVPWSQLSSRFVGNLPPAGYYHIFVEATDPSTGIVHQGISGVLNVTKSSNNSSAVSVTKNSGFTAQTVSPNTANVKIGSFMIKNNSNGQEHLSNIAVNLSLSGYSVTNLSNLRLMVDSQMTLSTPIGNPTQGINNFPVSWGIGANASPTVDIYADIAGASTGSVVANMSADGITSTDGVPVTSSASSLANPVLSQNSPASQYVIGGSTFGIATYRLATTQAGTNATVRELRFVAGGQDAIESITVNGITGRFADGQGITIISGLNIPVSSTGVDIPVTVKFSGFQYSTSGGYLNSGVSNVGLKLNYIEATSGSGQVITNTTPVSSNGMTLVASRPTVTLGSVVGASPLILGIENKIGEFTVTADVNGKISLSSIGLALSSSGITNVSYDTFRVLSGNTPIVTNENGYDGSVKYINFYSPYEIGAGQATTFSVYARVNGKAQAGLIPTVSSSLVPSNFTWKDVIGGNVLYTGDNLVNFPMNSYTTKGDGSFVFSPTVSISAYPTTINQGQSSTISWESLGTTSCMANSVNGNDLDWMGNTYANGKPSGSVTVSPTVTSIYEISCNNSTGGNIKKTVTVTVNNSVDITPSITSISQSQIEEGSNTTVTIYGTNLKFINNNLQVEFFKDGIDLGASGVNYSDVNGDGTKLLFTFIPNVWQSFNLKAGNMYKLRVSNDAQKNKSGFLNIVVLPAPVTTCSNRYWIDNTNKDCSQKQFCGSYMYQGLQTFDTQQACLTTATQATGVYSFPSDCPNVCGQAQSTQTALCTGGNGFCIGAATTRTCNATASCVVTPTCSDPTAYYYYYAPDVKTAGVGAKEHWDSYGYKEGRKSCWQAPVTIAPGTSNNKPTGVIDSASSGPVGSCGNVSGWAYDADNSLASTEINLYVDGPAGSGTGFNAGVTTGSRTDVNQYFGLPGGNHGYNYQIPNLTPGNHTVYSYSHGVDTSGKQATEPVLLVNSPMSFNCTNPVSFLNPSSQKPVVLGDYISNVSCTNLPYNMHRGYEDNNVKNLQSFLVSRGLLTDTPTSFYGDKTVEAVKAYQSSKGLPVTGMVFDFTRSAIKAESCK
ncbi:TPA: hypothetical protein DEP94_04020 [Candidatus Nomurabacteria bacterium]|nr:hypothetical protein [Candidatus Nomurabacteria bacterium]